MATSASTLRILEYDKIIDRLARMCETSAGRELALALQPTSDYGEALHRQRLTAEARRLLGMKRSLSLASARDVRALARQAALGHVLTPADLVEAQSTLSLAAAIRSALNNVRVYVPLLATIADTIPGFGELAQEISRCVNLRGEVLDRASPVLAQLREDARSAHDRLYRRLQRLINSVRARPAIQEPIVTLRDGRYVVPVKAEMRSQLPGIVHDVSSSGATLFLEPLETVEMGNAWRQTLGEEERETERILRRLSGMVGERAADIAATVEALSAVDLALAKARLGDAMGADQLPRDGHDQPWLLPESSGARLANARHPLLTGNVVPITLWLGATQFPGDGQAGASASAGPEGHRILLITGPNTGGKTVALKTVGLLSLMAAAGLPIPADAGSRLPVFDSVHADIGDEQSIEQSLSTFSSHIGKIIGILSAAGSRSLVLLDELGAGTDPVEGAALAKAILSQLLRLGCLAVATTHHGELKAFAHVTLGIANASVEFDPETLAPSYRLQIGLPGQSNALNIARRLGMPEEVLEEARSAIEPDRLAVEALILDLHRQREAAASAQVSQERAEKEARSKRDRVAQELAALERRRDNLYERTRMEMEGELSAARKRLREAIRQLERMERLSAFEETHAIEAAQAEITAVEEAAAKVEKRRRRRRKLPLIEPGDRLYLRDLPLPGEAIGSPDAQGELEVRLGNLRARVPVGEVERVEKRRFEPERREVSIAPPATVVARVAPEIHLRGLPVDEALALLEQRLDEAFRAGVSPLRVVHGKGTGTMRRAVRELLAKHPLVRTWATAEPREGGEGVTVADLSV